MLVRVSIYVLQGSVCLDEEYLPESTERTGVNFHSSVNTQIP
jgi:quercetin dioxygenase-like cupin family protein